MAEYRELIASLQWGATVVEDIMDMVVDAGRAEDQPNTTTVELVEEELVMVEENATGWGDPIRNN